MPIKISANFPYPSHYIDVFGSKIHYIEKGEGDPILFLHGVPASNYVWRNIIPFLSKLGRCIAPDLIGFGKSEKPAIDYSIDDHIRYIDQWIETLDLKNIIFVLHGFGSIVGFNYAMKHQDRCKGLVFYEAYLSHDNNEMEFALPFQEQLYSLQNNHSASMTALDYIDKMLSQSMLRTISDDEMSHYKKPFLTDGSEKPLVTYLNELTYNKERLSSIVNVYSKQLKESKLPKLMFYSLPGFITTMETVIWAKENLPRLEISDMGHALHYAQEVNPSLMAKVISAWLQGIEQQ